MNWRSFSKPAFLVSLCVLAGAALGMGAAIKAYGLMLVKLPIYPPVDPALGKSRLLNSIPQETTSWIRVGTDRLEHGEVLETLGTDNYVTRTYARKLPRKNPGDPVQIDRNNVFEFHAAYYTGMIDTVPHVPDRCFVAGGMQLADLTKDVPLPLDQDRWFPDVGPDGKPSAHLFSIRSTLGNHPHLPRDPQELKLHSMKFVSGGQDLYAGYFFIANGGAVPRAEDVRLLAFDLRARYAYYLKVQFTSSTVKSEEDLALMAADFLNESFGDIMECVPDWAEVEAGNYPPDNPARAGKK